MISAVVFIKILDEMDVRAEIASAVEDFEAEEL